jgi:hypothetical protein
MGRELLTIPERECLTIYLHEPEEVYCARVSAGLQSDGTQRVNQYFIGKRRPDLWGFPRSIVGRLYAAKP